MTAPVPLLTVSELAIALNICERTAWRLVWRKKIRIVRIGRLVRVRQSELDRYIEQQTR